MNLYFNICVLLSICSVNLVTCTTDKTIISARIESCPGCSLNRLPEVKKFIFDDVPLYDNVEFKRIHGAVPELVLLNEADEEVERLQLSRLSRKECNDLLVSKGFHHKGETTQENHHEF